ncbi:hypothetical protein GCM10023085_63830 [Actinomadura viridis]|uniref:RDD family membrane protein YckC n=1 Tax=Actinomadura viridis TaxID=58110 RepID=A0A931GKB7_9ACTN|nr:RDD family protein [Actinomadura viridis]MBG6086226.1 putative RDD family membrane protein YckC [Actinomadura viridis]
MAAADQASTAGPLPGEEPSEEGGPSGLAEPGQRLLARIVDTLVVGLPVVVVVREVVPAGGVDVVAPAAVAGFLLLYEWIQLALWGRTLGKRFAGIEVVRQTASEGISAAPEAHDPPPDSKEGPGLLAGAVEPLGEGAEPSREGEGPLPESFEKPGRLGLARSLLRTATYALPIAVRPVPVFGVVAGLFWVGNAAMMYEGERRQALHDRLAGTVVVKRGAA